MAKFVASITLPLSAKELKSPEYAGRSRVRIKQGKASTEVTIESTDLPSLKAAVNAILRDATVIESVSSITKNS